MSFQPVLSACVLRNGTASSSTSLASLYIDADRVLRAAGGSVPGGLSGLTDCVEVRASSGMDFAVRRRDGSAVWCYRYFLGDWTYQEFKPGDVIDGVALGFIEECEAGEDGSYASLTLRDKNGCVFWLTTDRSFLLRSFTHRRLAASGNLIRAVSVGSGLYVGADGILTSLSLSSEGRLVAYQRATGLASVSGRYDSLNSYIGITTAGKLSGPLGLFDFSSYTALQVRSFAHARYVPGVGDRRISAAIVTNDGKRYAVSIYNLYDVIMLEAPTVVALWEYGHITVDGAVVWHTGRAATYNAKSPSFFGPLATQWGNEVVGGQASIQVDLQNKIDDFVCYFTAESGFSALFQSLLTIEVKFESVGTLAVRWSPEYGNIVQIQATFAAVGVLSASFSIVTTPATVASFAGVCVLATSMQVERTLVAAFEGVGRISTLLDDKSVFRDGVTFRMVGAFSARMEIGRVFPDAVVRLFRKVVAGGMSVEPYNDVTLRGARYRNARWTREGTIPLGLNWGSSPDGLRFWGTPQETGEMTAIFEGPYPDGFQSNLTDAGQQSGGVVGCANLNTVGSFLVDRYEVKFIVEEVPADVTSGGTVLPSDFTLGEVLAELLTNASSAQWATRSSWTSGVRVRTRGGTASVASSNSAASVPASVPASKKPPLFYTDSALVQAGLLTPTDMAASDWKFALPAATPRGRQGVLRTAGVVLQAIATETDVNYADYVGEALDGQRRVCAFQSEIPLLPGVSWGEFYLRAAFSGVVSILFYTTQAGALTPSLAARLGVKTFARVQESTASRYRGAREDLGYDFTSGETMQVCRAAVPMEGRHGVYRLHVPQDIAPGTMANLSIFVKEGA